MKPESLKMTHKSLKKKENNEKDSLFRGKFTKSSVTFRKNKPNSPSVPIHLNSFLKMTYANLNCLTKVKFKANQTQYKANSNPIAKSPEMSITQYNEMNYKIFSRLPGNKTNPNFILDVSPPCFSVGGKPNNLVGDSGHTGPAIDFSFIKTI